MTPSRRHELKTNELSVFLKQVLATAKQNLNYVIGGVVLVVAILAVGLYIQRHRHDAREQAQNEYRKLAGEMGKPTQATLDRAREMAAAEQGNGDLGPQTAVLAADAAYQMAMDLNPAKESAKRLELLRDARTRYEDVIKRYADQPALVAATRFSLAKTEESLLMAGDSTKEKVLAQYQALTKDGTFKTLAEEAIATLNERLQPLKVVATRPAEVPATAPATQPAAPAVQAPTQAAP